MSLDRFVFDLFFEELQMCQVSVFITNRICNSRKVILPLIRWCNLSWPWRILVFSLPWSLANLFTLSFFFKTMRFHENRTWIELKFLALERINFALKFRTPRTGTVLISTSELCSFWTVNGQFSCMVALKCLFKYDLQLSIQSLCWFVASFSTFRMIPNKRRKNVLSWPCQYRVKYN